MIKINPYYQTAKDLNSLEEPYKSLAIHFDRLYLEIIGSQSPFSTTSFKNTLALSCIKTIAEDLAKNQITFIHSLKTTWRNLLNPQKVFTNEYSNYSVPYLWYMGAIFGGVYYLLSKLGTVDEQHLKDIETILSNYSEATPYFNYFKDKADTDIEQSVDSDHETQVELEPFIKDLCKRPELIEKLGEVCAILEFEYDDIKKIFEEIETPLLMDKAILAITDEYEKLVSQEDPRCYSTVATTHRQVVTGHKLYEIEEPVKMLKYLDITQTLKNIKYEILERRNINKAYDSMMASNQEEKSIPMDHPKPETQLNTQGSKPAINHQKIRSDQIQLNSSKTEEWDDTFDDIFDNRIDVSKLPDAIRDIKSSSITDNKKTYVIFRVLVYIKWISNIRGAQKKFLKWYHYHIDHIKKEDIKDKDCSFTDIHNGLKHTEVNNWNENTMTNKALSLNYQQFAITVKNKFTQTVVNGLAKDNCEFNAGKLIDRSEFIKGSDRINYGR